MPGPGGLLLGEGWNPWSGGVCSRGVPGPGGCLVLGRVGIPACTEADPPK